MSPIWIIARREFTQNILSLRLFIGLVICLVLFVASTYVLMEDYEKRLSVHNAAEIEHRNALEEVKVYSHLRVEVAKQPEPLSVICLGMERQLGSTVKVSYEDVPTEAKVLGGGNPLLTVFSAVDAGLMVQIAFSLFVISIAYDVICGERESGTLALVASNPVSKYHILIGKYIGGMASLLVPLTIGWIVVALLLNVNPVMEFHIAEWSRFCLLFAALALYLSAFFLLSMLVSAITQRSARALVWLLFLWIVIVFVIPNSAVYIAKQVRPIPSKAVVNIESAAIRTVFREKIRDYGAEHRSNSYFATGYSVISGNQPFAFQVLIASREAMLWYLDGARFYIPHRVEYAEQIGNLHQEYYRSLPRATLLFGKYIGTIISLSIPLVIGICMNTLIVSLFGILPFESTYWLQIGGVVLFSVLYISVFATLGLFISCLTRSSSVSLVLLLLVWVCFVVFIPRTGGLLASRLAELPDEKTIAKRASDTTHDIRKRYGEGRFSARWSPGEPLTRSAKIADAKQAIYNEYRQQQLHQVKLAQNISRLSPTAIYQIGCEALVGTGIKHYERFFKKAIEYRRSLLQFTYEEYPFNPNVFLEDAERQELAELRISLDKIPKFDDTPSDFPTALVSEASLDILLLLLFNLVFFMGAFLSFTRYDV